MGAGKHPDSETSDSLRRIREYRPEGHHDPDQQPRHQPRPAETAAFSILAAISLCHFLNAKIAVDAAALYPLLKQSLGLGFQARSD